jgi:MipA family protein
MFGVPARLTIRWVLTLLAAVLSVASVAEAQGPPPGGGPGDESKSSSWGLGVGALSMRQPYADIDSKNLVIPLIFFENRWVQLLGPTLEFKLPSFKLGGDQELSLAAHVEFDGGGYKPEDAPILRGMNKRKDGLLAGASAKWSNPLVDVAGEWAFDIANASRGQRFSLGLERSFFLGKHVMLTPSATARWLDEKYVNYYFGVRSAEARADRPVYAAESTVNTELSLRTNYLFNERQSVFVSLDYTVLGREIKNSPLTDSSGESMVLAGYLFRF